jgi:ABC-2 type transport system ATP-binding protein
MSRKNETGLLLEVDCALSIQKLSKRYGAFTAVDQLSFEIRRNEIFGLLGPNGAGKN